jgi:hypothetical protein
VKKKVKVKFTLAQVIKRGTRGIALLFSLPRHLMGWVPAPRPGRFTPGKEARYPLHRRHGAKNLVPAGIRFPNRPASRHSLYNCTVPAQIHGVGSWYNCNCAVCNARGTSGSHGCGYSVVQVRGKCAGRGVAYNAAAVSPC